MATPDASKSVSQSQGPLRRCITTKSVSFAEEAESTRAFTAPAGRAAQLDDEGPTSSVLGTHRLGCLVRDRFREFREIANIHVSSGQFRRSGTQETLGELSKGVHSFGARIFGSADQSGGSESSGAFMRQFFTAVGEVQGHITKGRSDVQMMNEAVQDALGATSQAAEQEAARRVEALGQEVSQSIASAKTGLEILKARTDEEGRLRPNTQVVKIRNNMQQAMARKHHDLLLDFQKAQMGYKDSLQRRQARELEILMPEISEEERQEMLQNGETSSMVLVQKMAGAHASLLDEVNRIRDKHQDILRLEQNIADLAQMFQEMAVLVDAQGEMLDSIEVHVHQVKSATAKAEQNLKQTLKAQHKHRKYMCCLMIIMVIVAISILAPVLVKVTE